MKISIDKKYTNSTGEVRVLCVDAIGPRSVVVRDGFGEIYQFYPNGRFASPDNTHEFDLIEYHEPDIRTIWVNVYPEGVIPYANEVSAKMNAENGCISIAQPVTFEVKRS